MPQSKSHYQVASFGISSIDSTVCGASSLKDLESRGESIKEE